MNLVILTGRLTRDPEVRMTTSNKTVTKFTLAVDRTVAKGAEKEADFFNCTAFDKTAEFIGNYFSKGRRALVQGRIQNHEYEDRDGQKKRVTDIIVSSVEFMDSKKSEVSQPKSEGFHFDEDVPF